MTTFSQWVTNHMFALNLIGWGLIIAVIWGLVGSMYEHLHNHFMRGVDRDNEKDDK